MLDGNVLIARSHATHVHHLAVSKWLGTDRAFATCPITQGTLVRFLLRAGHSASDAWRALGVITARDKHEFWPDGIGYGAVRSIGIMGHRQVTDAYLAELARRHGGRVATLDGGFITAHPDIADRIETDRLRG
jgi:toxin-antitoxin system PIN domain toxin